MPVISARLGTGDKWYQNYFPYTSQNLPPVPTAEEKECRVNVQRNEEKHPREVEDRTVLEEEVPPLEVKRYKGKTYPEKLLPEEGECRKDEEENTRFHVKVIHVVKEGI